MRDETNTAGVLRRRRAARRADIGLRAGKKRRPDFEPPLAAGHLPRAALRVAQVEPDGERCRGAFCAVRGVCG